MFNREKTKSSLTRTVKNTNHFILYRHRGVWEREFRGTFSPKDIFKSMKLKEYIKILQTFNPEVEVLKKVRIRRENKQLVTLEKSDIIPPHVHFRYDPETGHESLVDSFVV